MRKKENTVIETSSTIKVSPSKIAQRCPVCNGFGTLKWGSLNCQACSGLGYVLVPAKIDREKRKNDKPI